MRPFLAVRLVLAFRRGVDRSGTAVSLHPYVRNFGDPPRSTRTAPAARCRRDGHRSAISNTLGRAGVRVAPTGVRLRRGPREGIDNRPLVVPTSSSVPCSGTEPMPGAPAPDGKSGLPGGGSGTTGARSPVPPGWGVRYRRSGESGTGDGRTTGSPGLRWRPPDHLPSRTGVTVGSRTESRSPAFHELHDGPLAPVLQSQHPGSGTTSDPPAAMRPARQATNPRSSASGSTRVRSRRLRAPSARSRQAVLTPPSSFLDATRRATKRHRPTGNPSALPPTGGQSGATGRPPSRHPASRGTPSRAVRSHRGSRRNLHTSPGRPNGS